MDRVPIRRANFLLVLYTIIAPPHLNTKALCTHAEVHLGIDKAEPTPL